MIENNRAMSNAEIAAYPYNNFSTHPRRPQDVERRMQEIQANLDNRSGVDLNDIQFLLSRVDSLKQDLARSEALRKEQIAVTERISREQKG